MQEGGDGKIKGGAAPAPGTDNGKSGDEGAGQDSAGPGVLAFYGSLPEPSFPSFFRENHGLRKRRPRRKPGNPSISQLRPTAFAHYPGNRG